MSLQIQPNQGSYRPSVATMLQVMKAYIPPMIKYNTTLELPKDYKIEDNGTDFVKRVMEASEGSLRMYGTPENLAENLKMYYDNSSNMMFSKNDLCEPFSGTPKYLESCSGGRFILKQDLLILIQQRVEKKIPLYSENRFIRAFLALFLNLQKQKMDGAFEYVSTDNVFEGFKRDVDQFLKNKLKGKVMEKIKSQFILANFSFEEILNHFKALLKTPWLQKYVTIEEILKECIEEFPPESNAKLYETMYVTGAMLIRNLTAMFESYPVYFEKSRFWNRSSVFVRLFDDDIANTRFMPNDELNLAIGQVVDGGLWTAKREQAALMIATMRSRGPMEVLLVPINRAQHSAPFILNRFGVPHKLSHDVLFELLYGLIHGMQLFQRFKTEDDWKHFETVLNDNFFLMIENDRADICFIDESNIIKLFETMEEKFSKFLEVPVTTFGDFGPESFSEKNLKDEIVKLGLQNVFPDIVDTVQVVLAHVNNFSDAIYHCQIISLFKKFPKFAIFVHQQNGCQKLPICQFCSSDDEQDSGQQTEWMERAGEMIDVFQILNRSN